MTLIRAGRGPAVRPAAGCTGLSPPSRRQLAPPRAAQLAAWPGSAAPPGGDRLLHLDLHRFNVLIDGDAGCGVLDWTNAAAGHPVVDRARSFSILTLDPAEVARRVDPRWVALTDGWIDGGELRNLPAPAMAWASRFMLDDLSKRYDIQQLAAVAAALEHAEWLVRRAR